jgi:hypothetical protein
VGGVAVLVAMIIVGEPFKPDHKQINAH